MNDKTNPGGNFGKLARKGLQAPVPRPEGVTANLRGYGTGRAEDGRTARKTGRTVYFNTVVSPDFKVWLKSESRSPARQWRRCSMTCGWPMRKRKRQERRKGRGANGFVVEKECTSGSSGGGEA